MGLQKAEEFGNKNMIADRLYWCGVNAYQNKEADLGMSCFEKILEMKDELLSDPENECMNKNTYTLAYSAAVALKRAGKINRLKNFVSTAPSIARTDNGYSLAGEPGFFSDDNSGRADDIFYDITRMEPCLSGKEKEGYVFEQNTLSHSHEPVRSRFEVISTDEKFEAPAGLFEHCLHTRYTNFVVPEDEHGINKCYSGISDIWYAPGVGVAGYLFTPVSGGRKYLKLKTYAVESAAGAKPPELYLPLAIGNKWSYEAFDENDAPLSEKYEYENLFEVVCMRNKDNAAVIAHSAWGCPREE